MANKVLYLIGSLRNKRIPELAKRIRADHPHIEVFDDWYAAGPEADDFWKEYEQERGRTYQEALEGHAARNVFAFDKRNLDRATHALLVLPAGKSGHMEIMYATYGVGAKTAILLDPEDVRWDVMYQFVPTVLNNDEEINEWLSQPSLGNPLSEKTQDGFMITPQARDVRWDVMYQPAWFPKTGSIFIGQEVCQNPSLPEEKTIAKNQGWSSSQLSRFELSQRY